MRTKTEARLSRDFAFTQSPSSMSGEWRVTKSPMAMTLSTSFLVMPVSMKKSVKGLWFRKVVTSDTTFCIIIEQRIPANSKVTKISEKETKYWTEPTHDNICRFKNSYSIDGLDGGDGATYSDFGYTIDDKGLRKEYMAGYSITYFRIKDKNKKITITKDKFENLPADYKFENIIMQ